MSLIDRTLEYLQERRDKILNGGVNSIPSPFIRFSDEFIGVEQKKYYVVTGSQKSAKTQLASYLFLYTPLMFAYNNPDKIRLKIFYYPLEESPEDIMLRFMSFILNQLSKGKIRISPTDLQSSKNTRPVSQEVLEILKSEQYKEILQFFEDHVEFSTSRNPTGVWNEVKSYVESRGTVYTKKQKIKNEFGNTEIVDAFDYYVPDDPDEYVLVFFDHISLVKTERGMTLKQSADKLSEYCVELRNKYKVTSVMIQQQMAEMESLDAYKQNKLRPTAQGLADTKYTGRDCNVLLGIFSPYKHELPNYKKYDIEKLEDNARFLEVILNRGGRAGGLVGLFFDGVTCNWAELPRYDDVSGLRKLYNFIDKLRENTSFCLLAISKFINRLYSKKENHNFAEAEEVK